MFFRLLIIVLMSCSQVSAGSETAPARPNIIFILCDDLRWNSLGCTGNSLIKTPNIDQLAKRGTLFNNCFVTTSICAVSRASILSGQYARRHGIEDFATPFTREQWKNTYPALLRNAGYRTGFIGKFGVGNAQAIAAMKADFDFWRGLPGQAGLFINPKDPQKTHATARFGEQALEFLDHLKPEQPFCLSISFNAPHARDGQPREFMPDPRDESLYQDTMFPIPELANERAWKKLPDFAQNLEGRKRWQRRFADPAMFQKTVRDYARLITGIDREIERIVHRLESLKLTNNTIIIFTSDNGFILGERGMADKWLMYEESIRVPLIIVDPRLPKQQQQQKDSHLILNIDFAPTLLTYAGVPVPNTMQGKTLRPLMAGLPTTWRSDFFYEHRTFPKIIPPSEGVRSENWKYLRWIGATPAVEELYNLKNDPLETNNLVGSPSDQKKLNELRKKWENYSTNLR